MPTDRYPDSAIAPARHAFAITPHDVNPLATRTKAIRANGAGTVAFRAVDSAADVSVTMAAGETLDVMVSHVRATGTTATGLVGFA